LLPLDLSVPNFYVGGYEEFRTSGSFSTYNNGKEL
jgi:hypothetical protein